MSSAEKYVTAAYLVVLAVVLAWIAIHALKLQRLEREVEELEEREAAAEPEREREVVEAGRR
jgi:flagellar biosynthesis/type III secretory pathway M-ring protein FliF/YscJ